MELWDVEHLPSMSLLGPAGPEDISQSQTAQKEEIHPRGRQMFCNTCEQLAGGNNFFYLCYWVSGFCQVYLCSLAKTGF